MEKLENVKAGAIDSVVFILDFQASIASGHLVHETKRFHDKYGPIVRLAPNELSFISPSAWQDIYGHRKRGHKEMTKNPIWAQPSPNGAFSLINCKEEDHARMWKPFVPAFSMRALKAQEEIIQGYVSMLMEKLKSRATSGDVVVDIKDYYNWTTFDIIGDLGFGEPFDCLQNEQYHQWVSFLFGHLIAGALLASVNFYPWIFKALLALVPKSAHQAALAHHAMSCDKAKRRMNLRTDRKDIFSHVLALNDEKGLTLPELEATAAIIILAGSESTSTMLTGTTNSLMRNPEKLSKLTDEVRSSFRKESNITLDALEQLTYLRAVFQEAFRLLPPVPTQIPRIVPPEGDTICGHFIPGNTFVGLPQYAAYRSTENFIHPSSFLPERWLPSDSPLFVPSSSDPAFDKTTFLNDNKGVVPPFSVGPRNCIGFNLAYAEMRLVLSRLLWNMDLEFPDTCGRKDDRLVFEEQKTYALWEREPFRAKLFWVR
ncbi:hypothetical protein HYALB_00012275 [Hymenoscyphus albidus]|uniref:Cytochrome P450 monooxygenase n=1 Tax=Hymenoscyphus albidus TaxID=595503 RepID=A0A9N9LNQ7_9HELO|nr:hypothetical protein HYALB_00012275 [Hymenoscyphus albidus]